MIPDPVIWEVFGKPGMFTNGRLRTEASLDEARERIKHLVQTEAANGLQAVSLGIPRPAGGHYFEKVWDGIAGYQFPPVFGDEPSEVARPRRRRRQGAE